MSDFPVLGREPELEALRAMVAAAPREGSALLVTGEPGIGKSVLLAWTRAAAHDAGCAVLATAGVESEMHLPFGALHQTLSPLLGRLGELPAGQRSAITTALALSDGESPDVFLIAESALALLSLERRRRPVLVIVDDVHWLDPQSQQILTFVARRAVAAGICFLGAMRPDQPGPFAHAELPLLRIDGLDDTTAAAILHAHAGDLTSAQQRQIRLESQGNPLALVELPRSWDAETSSDGVTAALSARLERTFAGRVSALPHATQDLLLVAAVSSSSSLREILTAAAALGKSAVCTSALGPAVGAGLVARQRSQLRFRHPLVRSGVLQRESRGRRQAAHAALAEVLGHDRYRQSWHRAWSIVGPDDDVADALAETAEDSLRRGATMSASASLERAAHLTSSPSRRGQRLLQAALRAFDAGRPDVVARLLREATKLELAPLDEVRVTWLTEALNGDVGPDSALVRHLCDTARQAHRHGDDGLALNLALAAGLRCWWADGGPPGSALVVDLLDSLSEGRPDPRHVAGLSIAEPVLRGAEVLTTLASLPLSDVTDGDSLRVYGMAAYGAGDLVLATDLLDRAETSFRAEGRLGMLPVVLALQLHIRLTLGDWSGADLAGREVVTLSKDTGQAVFADNNVLVGARGLALRGDWGPALEAVSSAEAAALRSGINDRICLAYQARGAALLSAGRPAAAFACLQRQYDPDDPGYHLRESFAGLALTAEAAVACGHVDEARAITAAMETVAVVTPSPLLEVELLYASTVLALPNERDARYREALAHDLSRWPWLRARLQLSAGQWWTRTGQRTDASVQLEAAREVFSRIGAARWLVATEQAVASLAAGCTGDAP